MNKYHILVMISIIITGILFIFFISPKKADMIAPIPTLDSHFFPVNGEQYYTDRSVRELAPSLKTIVTVNAIKIKIGIPELVNLTINNLENFEIVNATFSFESCVTANGTKINKNDSIKLPVIISNPSSISPNYSRKFSLMIGVIDNQYLIGNTYLCTLAVADQRTLDTKLSETDFFLTILP